MAFKKDFAWGVSTAAYQIEGASRTDGRGLSVWDLFCRKEGAVKNGDSGDIACDHYHRYREDVGLMQDLGVKGYRFSFAWPRILPEGVGKPNEKGLDFYDRLVDALLEKGIAPYATLFHWDFPQALYEKGGWMNRDSAAWFAEYADLVCRRFSDRIANWMTLNEPQVFVHLGHSSGEHAPGIKVSLPERTAVYHHSLMAHGEGVRVLRSGSRRKDLRIGIAPVGFVNIPESESAQDVEAAREMMFGMPSRGHVRNAWITDAALKGAYPEAYLACLSEEDRYWLKPGDEKIIGQKLDFLGLNIYGGDRVRMGQAGKPEKVKLKPGNPITGIGWNVEPESLYWGPKLFHERYGLPILITENGLSTRDWVSLGGKVHDGLRIDFLHRYLRELKRAAAEGVPVDGYFQWSFLDNFEWAEGYRERFGLVHVDYETQKRTPKDSFHWYREVIATNGAILDRDEAGISA